MYVCKRCEKTYSDKDYLKSRFCQNCGAYLLASGRRQGLQNKNFFILTNRPEIENAQQEFETCLEKSCDKKIQVRLGYQGGNLDCVINWSEALGLWFHSRKLEGTFNFERIAISRYWNAFGLSEVAPRQNSMLPIVCEINPPLEGLEKQVQGAFARRDNHIWLLYRGKIGGGRPGIGRKLFFENYLGETKYVDGDRFAIIGDIHYADFAVKVKYFIREVKRIKDLTS